MPDLPTIWFLLLGVLILGYALLDGFDLGVGVLHPFVARTDRERRTTMATIGPVWDGNEVWLLTAGGALFAAFPRVYATVFSGFYLAMILLLVGLILRAVALEFRDREEGRAWRTTWDGAFFVGSLVPALLLGVALGNVVRGLPLTEAGAYEGGLLGLLNPFSLLTGLVGLAMLVLHGALWLTLRTNGIVQARARRAAVGGWLALVVGSLALTGLAAVEIPDRFARFETPLAWLVPAALALALAGAAIALQTRRLGLAFLASGLAIASELGLVGLALYPDLVPSTGPGPSLTVANAASSELTLTVMLAIALVGMPLVLAYTAYVYRTFWGKVVVEEGGY
ncbi:MAG TPA: cytochrome d ubiquinol oxidase subunit II [Candidatus Binatia bacterium]|nr:cytochrome d ubiquinol oxidase subunit II [Candidatus Binatia bacterium]